MHERTLTIGIFAEACQTMGDRAAESIDGDPEPKGRVLESPYTWDFPGMSRHRRPLSSPLPTT